MSRFCLEGLLHFTMREAVAVLLGAACVASLSFAAPVSPIKHVVVIMMENR